MWEGKPNFIGRGLAFSSPRPVTFHMIKVCFFLAPQVCDGELLEGLTHKTYKFSWGLDYYFYYLNYWFAWSMVDPVLEKLQ